MPIFEPFIRILIAAVLGGIIGIEREIREHTAGFRTHILVSVGSAAFTLASSYGLEGSSFDPNRISAQVVTGIGFLGAGAIIRYGVSVRGLTTAASLWTVAAVGLLAAQGFYSAALITTGLVIVSLYILRLIEERILYTRMAHVVSLKIKFRTPGYASLGEVLGVLRQAHIEMHELVAGSGENARDTVHLELRLPRGMNAAGVTTLLVGLEDVHSLQIE
jgi:putative Mg2+ transporter-C (MgtC) family protein